MKSNAKLTGLVQELKKHSIEHGVSLWKKIAINLENSNQNKRVVNLYKLEKTVRDGETVIVPGKVLAVGELTKPIKIAAFKFSQQAEEKIKKENPKGEKVRLMG